MWEEWDVKTRGSAALGGKHNLATRKLLREKDEEQHTQEAVYLQAVAADVSEIIAIVRRWRQQALSQDHARRRGPPPPPRWGAVTAIIIVGRCRWQSVATTTCVGQAVVVGAVVIAVVTVLRLASLFEWLFWQFRDHVDAAAARGLPTASVPVLHRTPQCFEQTQLRVVTFRVSRLAVLLHAAEPRLIRVHNGA